MQEQCLSMTVAKRLGKRNRLCVGPLGARQLALSMVEQAKVHERVDCQHMVAVFWGGGDVKDAKVGTFAGGIIPKDLVEETACPIHHHKPCRHSRAMVDCR